MTTSAHIHVIGLGVAEQAQLSQASLQSLQAAQCVIGWARHQAIVEPLLLEGQQFVVVQKLSELKRVLEQHQTCQSLAVVASGDPLFFGIGRWIGKQFSTWDIRYHPAVSSIQAACHKQGLSLQDVDVISLHGRPLQSLNRYLKQNATLVVLTDQASQPQALAQACIDAGYEQSIIHVHEDLGYQSERSTSFDVQALVADKQQVFSPLHVSVIQLLGAGQILPQFPGIPDHHYVTGAEPGKGMISKREVRLAILSLLQAGNDDVVWDIGAGCGGVAVELAFWNARVQVYAIEYHTQRLAYLAQNRERFGVNQNLNIVEGKAPVALADLPAPSKIFIGGSDGELLALLELAWQQLEPNGVLVASAVVQKSKDQLQHFARHVASSMGPEAVDVVEVAVRRGHFEDQSLTYVPKLPVEIMKFVKKSRDL